MKNKVANKKEGKKSNKKNSEARRPRAAREQAPLPIERICGYCNSLQIGELQYDAPCQVCGAS